MKIHICQNGLRINDNGIKSLYLMHVSNNFRVVLCLESVMMLNKVVSWTKSEPAKLGTSSRRGRGLCPGFTSVGGLASSARLLCRGHNGAT